MAFSVPTSPLVEGQTTDKGGMNMLGYGAKDLSQTERTVLRGPPSPVELRLRRLLKVAP